MPAPYGIVSEGYSAKTYEEAAEEIADSLRDGFTESVDLAAVGPFGQFQALLAEAVAEAWEALQAAYSSFDRDAAEAAALELIGGITGTTRREATPSTLQDADGIGTMIATGTNATALTAGRVASVAVTGVRFVTTEAATLATATAWATGTAYVVGDIRTNATRIYICRTAGTSAGSGGPTSTSADITDNTAHWRYLGEGAAYALVLAESEDTGPKVAASYTLTTIETPVAGWSSVNNLADAELGEDEETDPEFRSRQEAELVANEGSTFAAIRNDLLDVDGVTQVRLFPNRTMSTDADNVPAKAIEAVVVGGTNADIAASLWTHVAASIDTYGSTSVAHEDEEGNDQTVRFSRPTSVPIYCAYTVIKDPDLYPDDGDDQIAAAGLAFGDLSTMGKNVVASAMEAQAFTVPGVLEVICAIGIAVSPTLRTTIQIGPRELATFDSARFTVASSDGVP